jgi:hypothetical protein
MRLRRRYDVLEHHGERLTPVDGRVGEPFEDRVNLVPDGLPFGALARQEEFGQHAFEPVDYFGMVLKPRVGTTFVNAAVLGEAAARVSRAIGADVRRCRVPVARRGG